MASEHHDRIVCTSQQNQKTITNDFVIKLEIQDAEITDCSGSDKKMLLGRGSSARDIDYLVGEWSESKLGFNIKQAKYGCGVDCAIEEPKFTVESNGRSWSDAIKLETYRPHQRLTMKVQAEGEVSVGLGQTDDCGRAGSSPHSCFELAIGTGRDNDQLCLRPREDFDGANTEALCTVATGESFFEGSRTITVEWELDTSGESSHQLAVTVLDHDSLTSLDASWSLDPATYAKGSTSVEYVSFNAKRHDATFHVWVDYYPDSILAGEGSIDFTKDYSGEAVTRATVGIESATTDATVRVGDSGDCRRGTCIEIKFDRGLEKKAWVIDWSSDVLVVTDWETKEAYMEADIPASLNKITHISVEGDERSLFSVWVGDGAPNKHATHNRPAWIRGPYVDIHHTRLETQVSTNDKFLIGGTSHVRMVCSSSLGTGITDDVVSVTFKADETDGDLRHQAGSTCGNDHVAFTSSIGDFDYEVGASEDV